MVVLSLVVVGYIFLLGLMYYAQRESKNLGVTEYTDKAFYEPTANLLFVLGLGVLYLILEYFVLGE